MSGVHYEKLDALYEKKKRNDRSMTELDLCMAIDEHIIGQAIPAIIWAAAGFKLKKMDLSHNALSDAPLAIEQLSKKIFHGSNVEEFDLTANNIGDEEAFTISQQLRGSKMKSLDLSQNNIGARGANAIADAIEESTTELESLTLDGNEVKDAGAKALAKTLALSNLKSLSLDGCGINNIGMEAIAAQLPKAKITKLLLDNNELSDRALDALMDVLPQSEVTELGLGNNDFWDVESFFASLSNSNLTILDFHENKLELEETAALVKALPQTKLTSLNLDNTRLTDDEVLAIMQACAQSPLEKLSLKGNQFGSDGDVTTIMEELPKTKLTHLDLSQNSVKAEDIKPLANNLADSRLESLILDHNSEIGDEGLITLAKWLPSSKLKTLALSECSITDAGVEALIAVLPRTLITELSLESDSENISAPLLEEIHNILAANKARLQGTPGTSATEVTDEGTLGKKRRPKMAPTEEEKIAERVKAIRDDNTPEGFQGF